MYDGSASSRKGLKIEDSEWRWKRYRAMLKGHFKVLPFGEAEAETFAEIRASLRRAGTPRPDMDLLIASVAVTQNTDDFEGIPGLNVDNWAT